ncbi:unnamed protein product [Paramecium pentaurelia]|uniref:Uncharacterized protein n=1 Tax=Paramecium pentaurelia TaxID=43138 RepID=A0A8S1SML7_9CILI|nr:unnamed protein product [Paramecium pentaurelia]
MDKKLLSTPSEKLAADAADEMTCQNHMNTYTTCLQKHSLTNNYKECVKYMDQFRFCLLMAAKVQMESQKKLE